MIRGIFNSIIVAGLLKSAAVAGAVGRALSLAFNLICGKAAFGASFQNTSPIAPVTAALTPVTLRGRFNGFCNDNLGFGGMTEERRSARAWHLISLLKQVMQQIAQGGAQLAQALAIVAELAHLGVRVSGLLLDGGAPEYGCATKTQLAPAA